jgi:hypothetical protein
MAEWSEAQSKISETKAREEIPPLTPEQFRASPQFRRFKKGMRRIMKVSKSELDERIRLAKERSARIRNRNAPGRKRQKGP